MYKDIHLPFLLQKVQIGCVKWEKVCNCLDLYQVEV